MRITILTLFPEMVEPFFRSSIMKRAVDKGIVQYRIMVEIFLFMAMR